MVGQSNLMPRSGYTSGNEIRNVNICVEDPPIADIVVSGIIPLFVQFLTRDQQCTLQVISSYILI